MSHSLCAYHAAQMTLCESQAVKYWGEMMNGAMQAYVNCRVDKAYLYFEVALDVADLRAACSKNNVFSAAHITKPAEFLLQLLILESRFDQAIKLLSRLAAIKVETLLGHSCGNLSSFLEKQYEKVELAENAYMRDTEIVPPLHCIPGKMMRLMPAEKRLKAMH